jgi:peptidase M28-like protein
MRRRRARGAEALLCFLGALVLLSAAYARSAGASRSEPHYPTTAIVKLATPSAARYSRSSVPPDASALQFTGDRAFDDLKRAVAFGPRTPGSAALAATREWIIKQLKQDGCDVEQDSFVGSTPAGQIPMTNVIAKIPGARPEVIIIAGHYDTMRFRNGNFVGANDAGSSTAFLLEMARLLSHRKGPVTYWLVFFDGEEALVRWSDSDKLYGSRHMVQRLSNDGELSRIKAMILVDMIADAKLDIHRESNSTAWLSDIVFNTADRLGYSKFFLKSPVTIDDDHIPFVNAGVSAVDIIDLDYGPNNSYHHTLKDTIDKCSPASLAIVGRVVLAALSEIENSPNIRH